MRLTEKDYKFGPLTYGRSQWQAIYLIWSSGGNSDSDAARNTLRANAFKWVVELRLPNLLSPFRIKHRVTNWDAATVARLGRDWYYETHPREYGVCLSDGHLDVHFGAQTGDSLTEQRWGYFLPWTQWRFVRHSFYGLGGELLYDNDPLLCSSEFSEKWRSNVPRRSFEIEDYDGGRIIATTFIEEREWHFGSGWFKWLSLFRQPRIRRSLDINFNTELGPGKGSWKGGIIGHGIDMLPGELHEAAMRRYCKEGVTFRGKKHLLRFIGLAEIA